MSLTTAWLDAVSALGGSHHLVQASSAWQVLADYLEPRHPSLCAFFDTEHRVYKPSSNAQQALSILTSSDASSSKHPTSSILDTLYQTYTAKCQASFSSIFDQILQSCGHQHTLQVFDQLAFWFQAWLSPLSQNGIFESLDKQTHLLAILQTHLHSLMGQEFVSRIQACLTDIFLSSASRLDVASDTDSLTTHAQLLGLTPTILSLLKDVLHAQISRKVGATVDSQNVLENDEAVALESSARELLFDWLNTEIKPRFSAISSACSMAETEAETVIDDRATWQSRLDYQLDRILCAVRSRQLFDLIAMYPDSIPALQDLKLSLATTDQTILVSNCLLDSLQTRLLHPGAHTRDIIQIYVHMVRALRQVDPSGIVLSRVVAPLRRYLRARKDTITVIVSSLLGQDSEFTLLKDELEAADLDDAATEEDDPMNGTTTDSNQPSHRRRSRPRRSMTQRKTKDNHNDDDGDDQDDQVDEDDWFDPDWQPKPVDAGRSYRLSTCKDVIGMLISIFDDRQGFVSALESSMADQLIHVKGYRALREYRNNMILKKRFGERNMGKCDVMLGDITESRRVDTNIHSRMSKQQQPSNVEQHIHPLILSRQFWPQLSSNHGRQMHGTMTFLPKRFENAIKEYSKIYSQTKMMRKLLWLHHFGTMDIQVEVYGKTIQTECSILQGSIVELISSSSSEDDNDQNGIITVEKVMKELGLDDKRDAISGLEFWVGLGVLQEGLDGVGSYQLIKSSHQEDS